MAYTCTIIIFLMFPYVLEIVCGVPLAPTNGFVGKPTGNSEVQDTVNYQCSSGQSTAEILTAICTTEGTWSPNFRLLACDQISSPSPYICKYITVLMSFQCVAIFLQRHYFR